mmetsp:Transcript_19713/g.27338  ORF Transcript_19713/g.27338 Transcript_19713/m.27338 type:complete len:794 (+) Transcript_19713:113-2494(+)
MRIMIKGGVWKNTEDEILKAAVMKYGKNQWSRISSLLVRKSAKQCKARWFEWLDPSIKKTEWTREEEEKLLHLAKIMPTQWRTIAPIIGRTSSQCLERYEKLLDAAQQKSGIVDNKDDPRRLRPGEIDPNPEAKPARPDPVDMDEDEKEMLSEARARLANTQGKKAKRKARERQLEEARRLAQLQKRREMREAGITWRRGGHKRKRKWGVDYNAEIPFYKKAPKGYFDTAQEKTVGYKSREAANFLGKTAEEINGERRDVIEERERKKDARRQKLHRKTSLPEHLLRINKMNDAPTVQTRSEMILPSPQLNEQDLEQITRMGATDVVGEKGGVTSTLVADYNQTPAATSQTPMRTPLNKDTVMEEAENIIKLRNTKTPLLGGENADVATSFSGVTPNHQRLATPNPLATPSRIGGGGGEGATTPMRGGVPATPGSIASGVSGFSGTTGMMSATPARDGLGINVAAGGMTPRTAIAEKRRLMDLKKKMKAGFGKLPKAKHRYAIVVPKVEEEKVEQIDVEEDAEDAAALRAARAKAQEELEMKTRSSALRRDLPRTRTIGNLRFASDNNDQDQTTKLIFEEMDKLIRNDEAKYPVPGASATAKRRKLQDMDELSFEEMQAAYLLLEEEVKRTAPSGLLDDSTFKEMEKCSTNIMFLPSKKVYGKLSDCSKKEKLIALKQEFEIVRQKLAKEAKKAQKTASRLNIILGGYQIRAQKICREVAKTIDNIERSERDGRCFVELMNQEGNALPIRLRNVQTQLDLEENKEAASQQRFAALTREKEELMAELKIVNEVI